MDVAAPKNPAPAPVAVAPLQAPAAEAVPVRPAPMASPAPQAQAPTLPPAPRPVATKRAGSAAALVVPKKPVALITVTVFIMLVLSALAVTVYMTSQTA